MSRNPQSKGTTPQKSGSRPINGAARMTATVPRLTASQQEELQEGYFIDAVKAWAANYKADPTKNALSVEDGTSDCDQYRPAWTCVKDYPSETRLGKRIKALTSTEMRRFKTLLYLSIPGDVVLDRTLKSSSLRRTAVLQRLAPEILAAHIDIKLTWVTSKEQCHKLFTQYSANYDYVPGHRDEYVRNMYARSDLTGHFSPVMGVVIGDKFMASLV